MVRELSMARSPQKPQTVSALIKRPHWTVVDGKATFAPVDGGWRGTVSRLVDPDGPACFHIAIVDRTGVTRFASEAATLAEAMHRAESGVLARNALRLAG
jgi:hypothetical protein